MNTLFANILEASFHGSIVILAVLVLRLLLRRTPRKFICMLWLLAGLRLLMPFEIQSELSLQPEEPPAVAAQWQQGGILELPGDEVPVFIPDREEAADPALPAEATAQAPVLELELYEGRQDADIRIENDMTWRELIPWIWFAVVCGFALYTLIAYGKLRFQVREAVKIPGGWESDRIDTAFILGFIRPRIYIPTGMPEQVRRHILAHERTHLEKGDHWFKMLGFAALALHWFNPLVWLAYILLCKDIEMACDERVVQFMELSERKEYSAALLSCSANRIHYGACPVAFGEVSVKSRIKSVLRYRRPGFWISLVGVAAIVFVAVCLLTNPSGTQPSGGEGAVPADTRPTESTEPARTPAQDGFASTLSESEVMYTCEQALNALKERESYYIQRSVDVTSESEHFGSGSSVTALRRHGENFLSHDMEDLQALGGSLRYEGKYATYYGDAWAWEGELTQDSKSPDAWLDGFSPQGKITSEPRIVDENTVSFHAQWTESNPFPRDYSGDFYFTFLSDGSLDTVTREYDYQVDQESGGGKVHYVHTFTVLEEDPQLTLEAIQAVAEQAMSLEDLELYRLEREQVTEVPSNKTSYDKDFLLGSGQMGWTFMQGEWFFKFGAEDVTDTSARLVVEYNGAYGDRTIQSGTMRAGPEYFIERLEDGLWTTVEPSADRFAPIAEMNLDTGSSQRIDWEANYGALGPGFYRIGNYYTFTAPDGTTDTHVCYAKFRLYDPRMDALLTQCRQGLAALLSRDSYHLLATEDRTFDNYGQEDVGHVTDEVWKFGTDYLLDGCVYHAETGERLRGSGLMRRSGTYYGMHWVGSSSYNAVADWTVVTYPEEDNFQIWSWSYEFYDANVYQVTEKENTVTILELSDFYEDIPYVELSYTFDGQGGLMAMTRAYIRSDGTRILTHEMMVFPDDPGEAREHIGSQSLSAIPAFSWEEDSARYTAMDYDIRTVNFRNTAPSPISDAQEAIDRALRECTLPAAMEMDPGTNVFQASYDSESGMWKVEFTASWDDSICQLIYLDDSGITHLSVNLNPREEA